MIVLECADRELSIVYDHVRMKLHRKKPFVEPLLFQPMLQYSFQVTCRPSLGRPKCDLAQATLLFSTCNMLPCYREK